MVRTSLPGTSLIVRTNLAIGACMTLMSIEIAWSRVGSDASTSSCSAPISRPLTANALTSKASTCDGALGQRVADDPHHDLGFASLLAQVGEFRDADAAGVGDHDRQGIGGGLFDFSYYRFLVFES